MNNTALVPGSVGVLAKQQNISIAESFISLTAAPEPLAAAEVDVAQPQLIPDR